MGADLRARVQHALDSFIGAHRAHLDAMGPELGPVVDALHDLVSGGKRMRPAFCFWGYLGAGGAQNDEVVVAAASLELFQACALIHDDVMDGSDTRRGKPAVHRGFAARHEESGWRGDASLFGAGAAILVGDLALSWADEMLVESGIANPAALRVFSDMRADVIGGQYLDLLVQARGTATVEDALKVAHYKAAKYTVERPLLLGAALASAPPTVWTSYSAYGLPLGVAFQLRDDILGVYGDPAVTGKPAGDDLREGKRTALVAMALEKATPAQAEVLERLGDASLDDDGIAALRQVLVDTGAVARVEELIERHASEALAALETAPITAESVEVLRQLTHASTVRTR